MIAKSGKPVFGKILLHIRRRNGIDRAAATIRYVRTHMADIKVRRLPVLDHDKRLVGIISSLGDVALTDGPVNAGSALCGISEPGRRPFAVAGWRMRAGR